jgi:hypothetical protein
VHEKGRARSGKAKNERGNQHVSDGKEREKENAREMEVGEECLICLTWHARLNRSKCCGKEVCTACFVENAYIRAQAHRASACPFCKSEGFGVVYCPPLPPDEPKLLATATAATATAMATNESSTASTSTAEARPSYPARLSPKTSLNSTPPPSSTSPLSASSRPAAAATDVDAATAEGTHVAAAVAAAAARSWQQPGATKPHPSDRREEREQERERGQGEEKKQEDDDDLNCETESESECADSLFGPDSSFADETASVSSWSDSEYSDCPSSPGAFPPPPNNFGIVGDGSGGGNGGGGGGRGGGSDGSGDGDAKGVTRLHVATHFGRLDAMRSLMDRGAPPSARAANAVTPLHIAAKAGNADAAKLLLSRGADPDAPTTDRLYTPVHLAVKFGHVNVIRALCGGGGGGGSGGSSGGGGGGSSDPAGTASVLALASAAGLGGITPLHIACRRGRTKCAAALLDGGADMEAGTSPAATDGGIRPLHIAARFGHQSVVRLLVDRGADVNGATQRQLLTPLLIAAACGQTSIVAGAQS